MSKSKVKTIEEKYQKLTQRQHILLRSGMYVGDVDRSCYNMWVYDDISNQIVKRDINYSPALYKIYDEVLVNCIDHYTRLRDSDVEHKVTEMKININPEDNTIVIHNNGMGIEIVKHADHNIHVAEMIFSNLLSSSNYNDDDQRIVGGTFGIGIKLTNIYSTEFTIETVDSDRKLKYKQTYSDNLSIINKPKITKSSAKPYTKITFKPDLARFGGMTQLDTDIISLFKKRVYDVSACTDNSVSVWFNGEKLSCKSFDKYVNLYIGIPSEVPRVYEVINDRWEVIVTSSQDDKLDSVSFVNGICCNYGKHVDNIVTKLSKRLLDMINTKKKGKNKVDNIKQVHIKENMMVFIKCLIVNPEFSSQTKETLTTIPSKFGSTCEFSDKFIENIYKKTDIVSKAISLCNFKQIATISKTDGKKKNTIRGIPKLDDANFSGTKKSNQCTLILTEGDSAKAFAIAGLSIIGRDKYGVFPLKGKLLNVRDVTDKRVSENEEITNLKKIIGLQQYNGTTKKKKVYSSLDELRYGSILILTDQDVDGSHIKGLLINLFHHYWPSLLKMDGFIKSMATPIVKLSKSSNVLSFYTLTDYENWKMNNSSSGWNAKYYKGLGTSTSKEAKEYFRNFDTSKVQYDYTDNDNNAINLAFNKSLTDQRKEWLINYDKNLILDQSEKNINITDFVNKDLIHFSNYDNQRSIPSICDGLKPSQRKVLYGVLLKNLKTDIKVSQLTGYISEKSSYHHGEMSLQGTIISMAHNFVGSNNIELLVPSGQFGSRLKGGKDSASPRYIFTRMSLITSILYQNSDSVLLNYLNDDGVQIEPAWYLPIMPMILVNGTEGIGTGFSTRVPCYNPEDIVRNIRRLLINKSVKRMTPYYRGFTGKIYYKDGKCYSEGIYSRTSDTTVEITELPIGEWTDDYKEFLERLVIDKGASAKSLKDQCLLNYECHYTEYSVKFVLKFNIDTLEDMLDDTGVFEKKFKLINSKNTGATNMHLYNQHGVIQKYASAEEILFEFYDIRLEYYVKRRNHLLEKLNGELDILSEKIRFIEGVVSDEIVIFRKEDEEIVETLEEFEFMKVSDNFDYLINMSLRSLTKRKIEELKNQRSNKQDEYDIINSKTPKDLWTDDLDAFTVTYDKMISNYNKDYVDRDIIKMIRVSKKNKK
jgi:DNA topoisomerase-2